MALPFSNAENNMPDMQSPSSNDRKHHSRLSLPARPLNFRKEISLSRRDSLVEDLHRTFPETLLPSRQQQQDNKVPALLQLSPRLSTGATPVGNSAFAAALVRMQQKGRRLQQQQQQQETKCPYSSASKSLMNSPRSPLKQARTKNQQQALERLNALGALSPAESTSLKRKQARRRKNRMEDINPNLNATFQAKSGNQKNLNANQRILPLLEKLNLSSNSNGDMEDITAAATLILSNSAASLPYQRKNWSSPNRLMMMAQKSSNLNLSDGFGSCHRLPSTGLSTVRRVRSSSRLVI